MVSLFKLQINLLSTLVFFIINSESIVPQKLYSKKESLAIDEFRPMVSKFLTMDFHKMDAYLLRWIRYNNFDLQSAAKGVEKFHKFRAINDIDSILEPDGTGNETPSLKPNPEKYLPYTIKGHDRAGRPILYVPYGRWNYRKYVIAGKPEIAYRYFHEMFEILTRKVFREVATLGKNIDQFRLLVDLNGYSLRETGCIGCLPIIAYNTRSAASYGPFSKNITVVNTPRIFNPALSLIKSIAGDKLPIDFFDFDKASWQKDILKEVAYDQLPPTLQ